MKKGWAIFTFFLGLDIFSKIFALQSIPFFQGGAYPFGGIPVFEDILGISFSLNRIFNTGAAWGIFSNHPNVLFIFRLIIIALAVGIIVFRKKQYLQVLPLWLIGTGAIGNALDYFLYGHVVDFFHFVFWGYSFPIFNVADICITLGALWLFFVKPHSDLRQARNSSDKII